jgi:hypothetical protein
MARKKVHRKKHHRNPSAATGVVKVLTGRAAVARLARAARVIVVR